MHKNKQPKVTIKNWVWKTLLFYMLLVLIFVFLMEIAIAPHLKMQEYNDMVNSETFFSEKFNSTYNFQEISSLVKDKTYKESLLKLADSDSIQLAVNLSDSLVMLSIKGVVIHTSNILEFKQDKLLMKMPLIQQVKLFSQPLSVHSQYATIVKEPVVERQAPKDTLEAALNAWQPDTLIQNPAFVMFAIDHGLHLILEQDKNPTFHDKWKRFSFYNHILMDKTINSLSGFITFKKPEYVPTITVKIPVNELRAIYRALPEKTLIVLKL